MKQGRASSSGNGSMKTEPKSHAMSPKGVAQIGLAQSSSHASVNAGRGYSAPKAAASIHKCGSQGKH